MVWPAGYQLQGGKYIIEEVLGQGGFGITYKALHKFLNYSVVIKTPNEYLKNDPDYQKYVDRFIKEANILARISKDPHPHIVGVHDLFTESATHCLVMDFIPGENLFELVKRRGALPEEEIVGYVRQIGEALAQVHQAGLVHRDAHPGNIMLRGNGKAVLIDFGIAKELIPSTQSSTDIAGNHGFAPYEQMVRGIRKPTVDIYCLAATLYYAVTGQRPSTSLDRKLNKAALTPPNIIVPSISNRLNHAILKGMALEAKDRPKFMEKWLKLLTTTAPSTPSTIKKFIYKIKFWLNILFRRNLRIKLNYKARLAAIISIVLIFTLIWISITETRYAINSGMLPGIQDNDLFIVNKIHYNYHNPLRKDIILFASPTKKFKSNVGRVIGLPGEKVEVKDGRVFIKDQELQENYVEEPAKYEYGPVIVPPDSYLVLGDNRNLSPDSHIWEFVPRDHIIGKAVVIFWPLERIGKIE